MTRRLILALATGRGHDRPVLESSLDLARLGPAHIEVLHPEADPLTAMPLAGDPMSASLIGEMLQAVEQEIRKCHDRALADFEAWRREHGLGLDDTDGASTATSVSWMRATGVPAETVATRGRLADLVVAGRPPQDSDAGETRLLHAALFETGRPLLSVPPPTHPHLLSRPAILWNGSAQAARAVGDAIPILARAEQVAVLSIAGDNPAPDTGALMAALARRGIRAQRHDVAPGETPAGARLLATAIAHGASLVIMGAYGHSRLREMVLGGVTRHALSHTALPLFMTH